MFDFNDVQPLRAERPVRHDLDLIVRRLRDTAESWVPRLFPNGRRVGDEWRLANIHGDAPRKSGSCIISLRARMPATGMSLTASRVEGRSAPSAKRRASMARHLLWRRPRLQAWRLVLRSGGPHQHLRPSRPPPSVMPHRTSRISCRVLSPSRERRWSVTWQGAGLRLLSAPTFSSIRT